MPTKRPAQHPRLFGVPLAPWVQVLLALAFAYVAALVFIDLAEYESARAADCARRGGVMVRGHYDRVCVAAPPRQ